MPVMDGGIALECILADNPDAKIIVVSSVGSQSQVKRAIAAGIKDFIQKPINKEMLKKLITTQLEEA